ncbi:copper oxidase [Niastella koreensis]|uniref:Multicopper oxidase type 3 n=2 Tax=Niastella koreensis TaxID=354356 RepID=G8TFX5_NIAKG|nr:multicopper oxidase type 3 [Niastella koreensis GR20-10]OQP52465.1 copper oxidase [Niastella koreensis]
MNRKLQLMKKIFWMGLLMCLYFFAGAQTKVIYTCTMHPQIKMDKPGKCPICGMTLVKKTIKVSPSTTVPEKKQPKKMGDMPMKNDMDKMDMKKDTAQNTNMPMQMNDHQMKTDSAEMAGASEIQSKVNVVPGKTVRYDLYVKDTMVNFTGKHKPAIAVNGSIPAPTLIFTEGDTAEIYLHNLLQEETSLHWHGIILPNHADGVPFLTTAPVKPGETHVYKFKVVQNGTYWYHSHSSLQEQAGMYGALIFKTAEQPENQSSAMEHASMPMHMGNNVFDKEFTVVLSEWADENPMQIQRRLRTGNDWYSINKGSTQSYAEAIKEGYLKTKLTNEWKRMKAMDVSDVYYNRFLVNGKPENTVSEFNAGEKIKLKVVNAGASSYFWLGYAGGKITVIGNDGNDMVPTEVDRLIIAPAETYDLIVTIPENMSYEFRATSEDRTGHSSLWLGTGMKMPAPTLPRLKYFEGMKMMNDMMSVNGTMKNMGMNMHNQMMDMNSVMYPEIMGDSQEGDSDSTQMDHSHHMDMNKNRQDTSSDKIGNTQDMSGMNMSSGSGIVTLNYDMLRSPVKTSLPDGPMKVLHFTLTGNMNRYVWTIDNKTVRESDRILIKKGENVKIILTNNSMMRHPMHLHGHDFRVLNSQGEYAPLKNVIDIMPMETDTIEFAANQSGNWFFHCHILFHMMAGMGRVFTYDNSPVNPELPDAEKAYKMFRNQKDQNMRHLMIQAGLETNGSDGQLMVSSNRYALQGLWHLGYKPEDSYEGELNFGRYIGVNQWLFPYIGFDYHYKKIDGEPKKQEDYKNLFGQISNKNDRKTFVAGIQYTLPWLVLADGRIDGNGKLRFQLSREDVPVTKRLRFNIMGNTDKEYAVGFRYVVSKWFAISSHYDSDMGLGAGFTVTY